MRSLWVAAALFVAVIMSGCGGGASGPVPVTAGGTSSATGTARLVITIPKASSATSSAGRSPAYISSATQSVKITVTPHGSGTSVSGFPQTANLTATSTGCSSTLVSTQCTIQFTLAAANYDVTITTYDGLNGTGNALSAAQTLEITIAEGQANTLPISLGGIPTSVKVIAGDAHVGGSQNVVFTLASGSSGTLLAYGLDADNNVILGAGAPSVTVASSNGAAVAVATPPPTAPNAIGISSLGTLPIARITATVTPVSGTGTGAVSSTFTVQDPALHVIYVADYGSSSVKTYDALGNQLAPPGGFPGLNLPYTIDYDQSNQLLYVGGGNGPYYIKAYGRNGSPHTLSGSFPGATGSYVEGITYDPMNGYLYVNTNGTVNAYDGNGNAESISFTNSSDRTFAYGPEHGWLYNGQSTPSAWNGNGVQQSPSGGFPGLSPTNINVGYNGFNGWLYYTCISPDVILAYDQDGDAETLTGPFTGVNPSNQPQAIAADPTTGHVYVMTNTGYLFAYDANGNSLFMLTGLSDPLGITTAPPP